MFRPRQFWLRLSRRITGTDDGPMSSLLMRMAILIALVICGFAWVVGQAAVYQIRDDDVLLARGESRVRGEMSLDGRRGAILDRSGQRLLAVTVPVPSIGFYGAKYYADRTEIAYALGEALDLKPDDVLTRIAGENRFAMIKRHVTDLEADTIRRLQLPGVGIINEDRRFYPMGTMLGATLGYMNKDGKGANGVEARYDGLLMGGHRTVDVLRDAQRNGFYDRGLGAPWGIDGADLLLTIDAQIQLILETELIRRVEEEHAQGAMGVVLDAKTADILAIVSVPSVDPNRFEIECATKEGQIDDGSTPCRNKVIQYVYEPGSIGKMMAVAAAFDSGKVKITDLVNGQGGTCLVGNFVVTDVKKVGVVTVQEAVKYSSNCAMKEVALRTGAEKLHETLEKFGVGQGTGVDLPGEARGLLRPVKDWASTTLQTAGYGYGYSLNLLEIAGAAQTIANDGVRMVPRIALEVRSPGGETLTRFEPRAAGRVVSAEAARDVRKCLTAVVMDPDGTGTRARPAGYSAAGKTGTARANVAGKGYVYERFLTSFVGFAPAENPSIVVAITVIDPKENRFGGTVSGPVFRAVVEQTLPLRGILPDRTDAQKGSAR